jgi:hypothetical protein
MDSALSGMEGSSPAGVLKLALWLVRCGVARVELKSGAI